VIHVAFDLSSLGPQKSGVGVYTESLMRHFSDDTGAIRISGYSSGRVKPELGNCPELASYRHISIPTRGLYGLWNLTGFPVIERLVGPVDVYHGTNYVLPPVRRAKRVLTIHDLSFIRCPELCPPDVVSPYVKNVPRFCREADKIIAVSEFTKRELMELLDIPESKIVVIGEAIDRPIRTDGTDSSRQCSFDLDSVSPYLLFVGTLEKRKNIMGLLKAFNDIHRSYPHHLVLAGKPGYGWSECTAYIEEQGLGDRVHVLGYVSDEEKTALYTHAEVFVYPSLYEGFGLPILEAFAGGCPVVTMDTASMPEVAGDGAVYADADEPDGVAHAIRRVLDDADLRENLRNKGTQRLELFSWNRVASETVDVYRGLLS